MSSTKWVFISSWGFLTLCGGAAIGSVVEELAAIEVNDKTDSEDKKDNHDENLGEDDFSKIVAEEIGGGVADDASVRDEGDFAEGGDVD